MLVRELEAIVCDECRKIRRVRNGFSGPVFVFASGASAADFDLNKYSSQKFFVVNGAARVFVENKFNFFAYVFTDENFVSNSLDLIEQCLNLAKYFFVPIELYEKYIKKLAVEKNAQSKFFFINRVNRIHGKKYVHDKLFLLKSMLDKELVFDFSFFSAKKNKIGFSRNLEKGYFGSRTIPHIALQVIYYMGFDKVFIVGMDLSESVGRFYDKDPSRALPTSLDKDYERFILPSFKLMADRIVSERFQVYNASLASRLPDSVIKKIGFDELERFL